MRKFAKVIETKGRCKKCGKRTILGNGLCQRCWDFTSDYSKPRQYNRQVTACRIKRGEFRHCIVCNEVFYLAPSNCDKGHKLCRKCGSSLSIPPKPIWIAHKRYGYYDNCPICEKLIVLHLLNGGIHHETNF